MATIICIIDAYSTGKHLAKAFKKEGYECIHVKSSPHLPSRYQHREEDFIASYTYTNDIGKLLAELQSHKDLKFCIPGYESGVELSDLLSEKFGFCSNGSQHSALRRNKFDMCEAAHKSGLTIVPHCKSKEYSEILEWALIQWERNSSKPVVLKPLDSANGDNVHFCHNPSELETAFIKITSTQNQFGVSNREVLAEGFNAGTEYIINTVSFEGKHFIAEMWRIIRKPETTIYDKAEMMDARDEEWHSIETYTFKVLNALKIKYGAGTTELKYTPEAGAVLLETSARLMGGANFDFCHAMSGFTQLSLLVESYVDPSNFLARASTIRPTLKMYGMDILLISTHSGELQLDISAEIEKLPLESYHSSVCLKKKDKLARTVGQDSTPGEVFLMNENKDSLMRDCDKIRIWEEGFYKQAISITEPQTAMLSTAIS